MAHSEVVSNEEDEDEVDSSRMGEGDLSMEDQLEQSS